jgi:hypothetical protein
MARVIQKPTLQLEKNWLLKEYATIFQLPGRKQMYLPLLSFVSGSGVVRILAVRVGPV